MYATRLEDIDSVRAVGEQKERYDAYQRQSQELTFGKWFLNELANSSKVCLAIDLADVRDQAGQRFWTRWEEDPQEIWRS